VASSHRMFQQRAALAVSFHRSPAQGARWNGIALPTHKEEDIA
jgi:hypothetical protein